jgi:hypothetical protein
MANVGSLTVDIQGNAGGLVSAVNTAKSALSSFGTVAAGVAAGMGISFGFQAIINDFTRLASYALSTASQFEDFSASAEYALSSTAEQFAQTAAAAGGMGGKTASSALEATDALIRYNEKIKEIQDNITEVMSGQNVIDAQEKFTEQLVSLQESYAEKVQSISDQISGIYDDLASKHTDAEQRATDTISDMQDSHDNSMADKQETRALTLSKTKSKVAKAALQKQYDEEDKLAEDSFQRQLATKKKELDRNIKEQDEAAKEAADKQVARLKDQLEKEAKLEKEKEDKLKAQEADKIARLDADNIKKLAKYKQELADEERAWELSQLKRSEGGGGGAGVAGSLKLDVKNATGEWSTMGEKVEDVNKLVDQLSDKTPFTRMELQAGAQRADNLGVSFEKLGPIIADLAAVKGKDFGTTMGAVLMATQGRAMQLARNFGINGQMMEGALGRPLKTANDVFDAINKIITASGQTGAAEELGNTYQGSLMKVKNALTDVVIGFMGLDEAGKPIPGGVIDQLTKGAQELAKFIEVHRTDIDNFIKSAIKFGEGVGKVIGTVFSAISTVMNYLKEHTEFAKALFVGFGVVLGVLAATILPILIAAIIALVVPVIAATAPFIALGVVVALVFYGITKVVDFFHDHWKDIVKKVQDILKGLGDFFKEKFKDIGEFFDNLKKKAEEIKENLGKVWDGIKTGFGDVVDKIKKGIDDILGFFDNLKKKAEEVGENVKKALEKMNPLHKESPSLVDNVALGIAKIKESYLSLGNISMLSASAIGATQNYNSNVTNSPTIMQTNTFNVQGQANASNIASHLAFCLEHFGIV